jgi:hypothetical protein
MAEVFVGKRDCSGVDPFYVPITTFGAQLRDTTEEQAVKVII